MQKIITLADILVPERCSSQSGVLYQLPPRHRPLFAAAQPLLRSFDGTYQNYVLRQCYHKAGVYAELVTICLQQYTLLKVQCHQPFAAFQYSLQGRAIAGLQPDVQLPLLAGTYTLQYIPAATHQLLVPPGLFQSFYIWAERPMELLEADRPPVQQLMQYLRGQSAMPFYAGRWPITANILEILQTIFDLPAGNGPVGFKMAQLVNDLLAVYHAQSDYTEPSDAEPATRAAELMADYILQPQLDILQIIRQQLYMEQHALNYQFKKQYGRSISSHTRLLRAELALLLLLQKKDVDWIAELLGYHTKFSFEKQFRLELGVHTDEIQNLVYS